eukprot:1051966-Rhodomonas_salina.2
MDLGIHCQWYLTVRYGCLDTQNSTLVLAVGRFGTTAAPSSLLTVVWMSQNPYCECNTNKFNNYVAPQWTQGEGMP